MAVVVGGSGCGRRDRHYVTGKVRYPDGSPVTAGRLIVDYGPGAARQAGALIKSDGSFRIGEIKDGDGMPAGNVKVGVAAYTQIEKDGALQEVNLCDPKYFSPETSGLVFEVPKQLRWDIVVEKPTEKPARESPSRTVPASR